MCVQSTTLPFVGDTVSTQLRVATTLKMQFQSGLNILMGTSFSFVRVFAPVHTN